MDARVTSAFTRVHSPSKTGVNALVEALLPAHHESNQLPSGLFAIGYSPFNHAASAASFLPFSTACSMVPTI